MVTKIFVSQIDSTNSDGTTAQNGSYVKLEGGVAVWSSVAISGATGFVGSIGFRGSLGSSGYQGSLGEPGFIGPQGIDGYQGSAGDAGPGFKGSRGDTGYVGSSGISTPGYQGSVGNPGYQGSQSFGGFRGSTGFNGSAGTGFVGSQGLPGFVGSAGAAGSGMPFTYLTDLSPNTYTGRANYLVKVNSGATGITLVDGNSYVSYSAPSSNITFNAATANAYIKAARTAGYSEFIYRSTSAATTVNIGSSGLYNFGYILLSPVSGSIVTITLPNDVLSVHGNNHYTIVLYLKQDGTGSRTVDWSNQTIRWAVGDGIAAGGPTLSTTANAVDVLSFSTFDGGATWYGFIAGKGFAS